MKRACGTCQWFEPDFSDAPVGECRGGLPVVVNLGPDQELMGTWPPVHIREWCRHYHERQDGGPTQIIDSHSRENPGVIETILTQASSEAPEPTTH